MRNKLALAVGLGLALVGCQTVDGDDGPEEELTPPTAEEVEALHLRCATPDVDDTTAAQIHNDMVKFKGASHVAPGAEATIGIRFVHFVDRGKYAVTAKMRADQITVLNNAFNGFANFVELSTDVIEDRQCASRFADKCKAKGRALHPGDGPSVLYFWTGQLGNNLLGWATFPWDLAKNGDKDGVAIHFGTLPGGSAAPYNGGDTGTHEIGHWLGLYHTFQGGCCNTSSCGDYVTDTLPESAPTYDCVDTMTCGDADPITNFMDYTDDACMNTFSAGQQERVRQYFPLRGL